MMLGLVLAVLLWAAYTRVGVSGPLQVTPEQEASLITLGAVDPRILGWDLGFEPRAGPILASDGWPNQLLRRFGRSQGAESIGAASAYERSIDNAWAAARRLVDGSVVRVVLVVTSVTEGEPGWVAGLRPGDRLVRFNTKLLDNARGWRRSALTALGDHAEAQTGPSGAPAHRLTVQVVGPDGEARRAELRWPRLRPSALGISVVPAAVVRHRPPVPAYLGARGRSAGLVHGLGFVDAAVEGDLAGGRTVAATGALWPSGRVEEVINVDVKTHAALAADADLILVPRSDLAEARAAAGVASARVRGVSSLQQAVEVLCSQGSAAACSLLARE